MTADRTKDAPPGFSVVPTDELEALFREWKATALANLDEGRWAEDWFRPEADRLRRLIPERARKLGIKLSRQERSEVTRETRYQR